MKRVPTRKRHNLPPKNPANNETTDSLDEPQPIRTPGRHFRQKRHVLSVCVDQVRRMVSRCTPNVIFTVVMSVLLLSRCREWITSRIDAMFQVNVHPGPLILSQSTLRAPYVLDHDALMEVRLANIMKWKKHYNWNGYKYDEAGIDRRSNLSLQEFWDIYDGKWPVLLTDVVTKWSAYNWTGEFFNQHYGKERVAMKAVDGSLSQAVSLAVPLYKFYENTHKASSKSWTYIEDELFIPMRPELRRDIGDTEYLEEDFFQMFPKDVRPWNAMLLWGTKYSRSTLHMDPYNWTGTNAVIKGRKWWKMYPPGQDDYLYIKRGKKSGFPLDCYKYNSVVDAFDPDLKKYPLFKKAFSILFEQLPGEMLFIPSGWFHQAYNGDETLAISSQVMNRNNYRVLLEEVIKVGNIRRQQLPRDIDYMSPRQQVETVMSMLPVHVLKRGRIITEDILNQMKLKHPHSDIDSHK